jgi:hypothetical protein
MTQAFGREKMADPAVAMTAFRMPDVPLHIEIAELPSTELIGSSRQNPSRLAGLAEEIISWLQSPTEPSKDDDHALFRIGLVRAALESTLSGPDTNGGTLAFLESYAIARGTNTFQFPPHLKLGERIVYNLVAGLVFDTNDFQQSEEMVEFLKRHDVVGPETFAFLETKFFQAVHTNDSQVASYWLRLLALADVATAESILENIQGHAASLAWREVVEGVRADTEAQLFPFSKREHAVTVNGQDVQLFIESLKEFVHSDGLAQAELDKFLPTVTQLPPVDVQTIFGVLISYRQEPIYSTAMSAWYYSMGNSAFLVPKALEANGLALPPIR